MTAEVRILIEDLLACLPDNWRNHPDDETWEWCWLELSEEAQAEITQARTRASALLQENTP